MENNLNRHFMKESIQRTLSSKHYKGYSAFVIIEMYVKTTTRHHFFLRFYLFLERERERNIHQLPLTPPTGDLACNPGMFPNGESNQQPFSSQASTQATEPHQPEQGIILAMKMTKMKRTKNV